MKKILIALLLLWYQGVQAQFSEGWYRIGQSNQTEADALMELTADGQTLSLSVGVTYTSQNTQKRSIYISGVSEYAPSVFSKVRFIQKEVADPIYLDVYVGTNFASGTVTATIGNSPNAIQPMQFQAATIPSGYTVTEIELEALEFLSPFFTPFARSQAGGVDADADPVNEMQVLTISGDSICISSGNCVPIEHPAYTTTLAVNGNQLTVNDKTVDLPVYTLESFQFEPNKHVAVTLDNSETFPDTRFRLVADDDITTINLVGDSIMLGQDYYQYINFEITNSGGGVILGRDQNYLFDVDLNPAYPVNSLFIDPKNLGDELRRLILRFGNSDSASVAISVEENISGEIYPIDVNGTEVNNFNLNGHPNSWAELIWTGDRAVLVGSSNQSTPIAEQIAINPILGVNGATTQAALEDIKVQLDAVTAAGGADGVITGGTGTNGALTLQRSNGLSDITVTYQDNDTQLSEAEVDNYVANNGYVQTNTDASLSKLAVTTAPVNANDVARKVDLETMQTGLPDGNGYDVTNGQFQYDLNELTSLNSSAVSDVDKLLIYDASLDQYRRIQFSDLHYASFDKLPADLKDGDANTQLSEAQVDNYVANNGYVENESDPTVPANIKDGITWTEVSGKPAFAPTNAEQNVQADWNVTSTGSDAFIKNKPTIPTATSQLTNDANFANETYVDNAVAGAGGGVALTGQGNSGSATTNSTTNVIGIKSASSAFDISVFDNGNDQLQYRVEPHGSSSMVTIQNGGQIFAKRADFGNYGVGAADWWNMWDPFVLKRTPTSSTDTAGYPWDIAADENYLYIKTKDNGWKRVSLSSF